MPIANIFAHPLGLGMVFDGFPGYHVKAIDLDRPAFCFSVQAGMALVGFGAFPTDLIFGEDANPDTNAFGNKLSVCRVVMKSFKRRKWNHI